MGRPRVLFLCSRNSARSQMAEAFLNHHGEGRFFACSAGLEPSEIHPCALRVMKEKGLDLLALGHAPKSLWDDFIRKHVMVGYLITVCDRAESRCPVYPGPHVREFWGVPDPAEMPTDGPDRCEPFQRVRDIIEERVLRFLSEHMSE